MSTSSTLPSLHSPEPAAPDAAPSGPVSTLLLLQEAAEEALADFRHLPPELILRDERSWLLERLLSAYLLLSVIAYTGGVASAIANQGWSIVLFNSLMLLGVLALKLYTGLSYSRRAAGLIFANLCVGAYFTYYFGALAAGPLWLFAAPLLAATLFDFKHALAVLWLVSLLLAALGLSLHQGLLPWSADQNLGLWIPYCSSFLALDALLAVAIALLLRRLQAREQAQRREIERRLRLEDRLRRTEKMQAIGSMASGVAHDFNNILSVIMSFGELCLDDCQDELQREDLQEILRATHRGAKLTRQLLVFSRDDLQSRERIKPNHAIDELQRSFLSLLRENITLRLELNPLRADLLIFPTEFEQILLNLLVNAQDAMPDGGTITLSTERIEPDELHALGLPTDQKPPSLYLMLGVQDEGAGIPAEKLERIFEPFYTTKTRERGTGLGLSIVYGIVQRAGGLLHVESRPGQGSRFRIFLPLEPEDARHSTDEVIASAPAQGRILLVEDQQQVRESTARSLRTLGYEVLSADNPEDALDLARQHEGSIHLLLSDVIMPDLSGPELYARLRARSPDLPVLFLSGYSEEWIPDELLEQPNVATLHKPCARQTLHRNIQRLLKHQRQMS